MSNTSKTVSSIRPRHGAGAHRRRRAHVRPHRPLRRGTRIVLFIIAVASALGLTGVGIVFAGYEGYASQLPDAHALAAAEPPLDSHVYARDGTLITTLHNPDFRHEHIALSAVSRWAKLATIDVEDRRFYQNSSWDLPRIVKAGWDNVHHSGTTQGASTITEQLAKKSFLCQGDCARTVDRKIKQVILGAQIEASFSKDQILEMYLNRIEYGNHSIGIQSAAELYFQKSAHDLDLAEASMLSGLPNSPSQYNPLVHDAGASVNPLAKQRQRTVLGAMVSNGDVSQAQADAAYAEPLAFHYWYEGENNLAPDFVDYLQTYLKDKFGDLYIHPGGWEITTSLDLTRQHQAETAVHSGIAANYRQFNMHDGALVSIDPHNGEVLAIVGSWDRANPGVGQLNMALRPVRPGSTIKLFTYTAAIASRMFTMTTDVLDAPVRLDDGSKAGYSPVNYDRRFHGNCTLPMCLGNSLNVPAVKVEAAVGIPYITNLEIAAGLRSLENPANRPSPRSYAATLGGLKFGITPLELADGAAMIADLGVHHDPAPVLKITETTTTKSIYSHDPVLESRRVVPESVAFIMNEITSNDHNRVADFGPNSALTLPDRRVSAKTGTTDFFEDNWTVGWTPDVVSAVWVGNPYASCLRVQDQAALAADMHRRMLYPGQRLDDPYSPGDLAAYGLSPINDHCGHLEGTTGITGAAPIWNDYMRRVLSGTKPVWYAKPPDVVAQGAGDDGTFLLPGTAGVPAASAPSTPGNGCWYSAPTPQPGNNCRFVPYGTNPNDGQPVPRPGRRRPLAAAPPAPAAAPTTAAQ